jgi:SAM-dependent methyltransferase
VAIRVTKVNDKKTPGLPFKEHALAHQLLDGKEGIEIGGSSHNSFGLAGSINIAPKDGFEFYKQAQIDLVGTFAEVDIWGTAEDMPEIPDHSQDYVISSHVFEHLPNPLKALREWVRVLKDGGIIFMIVPQRDALPSDKGRTLSKVEDIIQADENNVTPDNWDYKNNYVPGGRMGHYWVYTPDTLKALMDYFDHMQGTTLKIPGLELVAEEDPDQKVKNGFCLVYKVNKQAITPEPQKKPSDTEMTEAVHGWTPPNAGKPDYQTDPYGEEDSIREKAAKTKMPDEIKPIIKRRQPKSSKQAKS